MKPMSFRLPKKLVELIDKEISAGLYPSRSEFIRDCIRRYLLSGNTESLIRLLPLKSDIVVSIKMSPALEEALRKKSEEFEVSMSELVKCVIIKYFSEKYNL